MLEAKFENVKEFKSKQFTVRTAFCEGNTYFSLLDISRVCGIKWNQKWLQREKKNNPAFEQVKILYPMATKGGTRRCIMIFGTEKVCRMLIKKTPINSRDKAWLENEVFANAPREPDPEEQDLRLQPKIVADTGSPVVDERPEMKLPTESLSDQDAANLEQVIEDTIFGLLEIKKAVKNYGKQRELCIAGRSEGC